MPNPGNRCARDGDIRTTSAAARDHQKPCSQRERSTGQASPSDDRLRSVRSAPDRAHRSSRRAPLLVVVLPIPLVLAAYVSWMIFAR